MKVIPKVAIIIECLTDNKNRTVSRSKGFCQNGGLGTKGSVAHLFRE